MIIAKQTPQALLCCSVFNYENIYRAVSAYSPPCLIRVFATKHDAEEYCKNAVLDFVYFDDYNEFVTIP